MFNGQFLKLSNYYVIGIKVTHSCLEYKQQKCFISLITFRSKNALLVASMYTFFMRWLLLYIPFVLNYKSHLFLFYF